MRRVRVVHSKPLEAKELLELLDAAGYDAMCGDTTGSALLRDIRATQPDAVLIDLSRLPSHGREIAIALRTSKSTRQIPLVFIGGQPEKIASVRDHLPDAVFATATDVRKILDRVITSPQPAAAKPVPMMQRYASRTAAEKLGITSGISVALLNAPRDYAQVLGVLPPNAELLENPASPCPLTLWFAEDRDSYLAELPAVGRKASATKLWILWRKGPAAKKSGLTEQFLRAAGIQAGLVDYKICSVNSVWSGILFAKSKKRA